MCSALVQKTKTSKGVILTENKSLGSAFIKRQNVTNTKCVGARAGQVKRKTASENA